MQADDISHVVSAAWSAMLGRLEEVQNNGGRPLSVLDAEAPRMMREVEEGLSRLPLSIRPLALAALPDLRECLAGYLNTLRREFERDAAVGADFASMIAEAVESPSQMESAQ